VKTRTRRLDRATAGLRPISARDQPAILSVAHRTPLLSRGSALP
jgi:hypothetical protein